VTTASASTWSRSRCSLGVQEGVTFVENALKKARSAAEATGLPAVADDSGLCVDALNGTPGVLLARWAGSHGDDVANLRLVLDQLSAVPDELRGASFVCAAALAKNAISHRVNAFRALASAIRAMVLRG
jgi:non-canonical purine NTP pyrophosphatase (RdgB/HAM1 family)